MPDLAREQELADLVAANAFRDTLLLRADGQIDRAPVWYGWVIVEAYLAGLKAERERCLAEADGLRRQYQSEADNAQSSHDGLWSQIKATAARAVMDAIAREKE